MTEVEWEKIVERRQSCLFESFIDMGNDKIYWEMIGLPPFFSLISDIISQSTRDFISSQAAFDSRVKPDPPQRPSRHTLLRWRGMGGVISIFLDPQAI